MLEPKIKTKEQIRQAKTNELKNLLKESQELMAHEIVLKTNRFAVTYDDAKQLLKLSPTHPGWERFGISKDELKEKVDRMEADRKAAVQLKNLRNQPKKGDC